jgi:hypothetical protein
MERSCRGASKEKLLEALFLSTIKTSSTCIPMNIWLPIFVLVLGRRWAMPNYLKTDLETCGKCSEESSRLVNNTPKLSITRESRQLDNIVVLY